MGYTHYWYRAKELDAENFALAVMDFQKLRPEFDKMGVRLAGGSGEGEPEITRDVVCFNGDSHCGHPANPNISIPWPARGAGGIGHNREAQVVTWFAGAKLITRTCDGDCSYETFRIERGYTPQDWEESDNGRWFECCKTAFRPYDLAVTAFLIIADHYLGEQIVIKSDGEMSHWFDAMLLCQTVLGYGLNFSLDAQAGKPPLAIDEPEPPKEEEKRKYITRDEAIKAIRKALRERSGKAWSVTGGRGTAWGWIRISAPPRRLVNGLMTEEDGKELAELLGLDRPVYQYESIPASNDYYQEYIDRAQGKEISVFGHRYWD